MLTMLVFNKTENGLIEGEHCLHIVTKFRQTVHIFQNFAFRNSSLRNAVKFLDPGYPVWIRIHEHCVQGV